MRPVLHAANDRRKRARRHRLAALLLALLPIAPAGAVDVSWLYDVEVPVEDQSSRARLDAASQGLAELLTRLTGLVSVPRNEAVSRALAAPDLYYNRFSFEQSEDGDGLMLRLQFTPNSVLNLIRDANLPIWRTNRPVVVAWIAFDDGRERRILGADSQHPVVEALRERARDRGFPLRLPLLDLADQLTVSPAAVWGRLSPTLEPASERYGGDIVLMGRVRQLPGESWAASWEFWVDGDIRNVDQEAPEPAPLGRAVADAVANELAGRYAVLDRGVRQLELAVSAVEGAGDYADLLRYFGDLEFIQEVAVSAVKDDRLHVSLLTAAAPEQLLELFRLDRRLAPDRNNDAPGPPIELVWQRR